MEHIIRKRKQYGEIMAWPNVGIVMDCSEEQDPKAYLAIQIRDVGKVTLLSGVAVKTIMKSYMNVVSTIQEEHAVAAIMKQMIRYVVELGQVSDTHEKTNLLRCK